eukprot:jgi/Tetstr1/429139/TSEL_019101.t1
MATHAKLIPCTPYGKDVRPEGMNIPLGALCSTGRFVEHVRHALFRGKATNNHTREVCKVTPHSEAAVLTFGGKPIVSSVQRNKIVSLPLAGTAASPKLHGLVGVLAKEQKRAGGIIKHNTNAVKNHAPAATQAVPGDN